MKTRSVRLVIFTSQVPWGRSEAFVLTEIAELARRVEALLVIPVRPSRSTFHGELAREVSRHAIRLPVLSPGILFGAILAFLRSPRRVGRALVEIINGSQSLRVLARNLVAFPKAVYVASLIRRFKATHLHACWASVPATMALVASRLTGVAWSFTAHRWDIEEDNMLGVKLRAARFVRSISLKGRDRILRIIGESSWPTLVTLHVGVPVPEHRPEGSRQNGHDFSIACIANLVEVKGHHYLIEGCRLLQERGHRFVCHIIGEGPLRQRLESLVRELGLEERVRFMGAIPHESVIRMLQGSEIDLVVLPSIETGRGEHEGIPVALMEALAHGIPVISTETGGIAELLGNGAGILIKPADPVGLANAIEQVLNRPGDRALMSQAGFARISSDFNLRSIADQLIVLMEQGAGNGYRGDSGPTGEAREPADVAERRVQVRRMGPSLDQAAGTPFVSVIVPLYNDVQRVGACLHSILEQDYPPDRYGTLVVDGGSSDGSREVVQQIATADGRVRLLDNPLRIVSGALNLGLENASGRYIIRVDSHCVIERDYIRRCVEALETSDAANVGGPMRPVGSGLVGEAVALATSTRFGIANSRFHYITSSREWVDSVYLGAFRREVFDEVGLFDPSLVRNQDDEFNYRLRLYGRKILLVPEIRSWYFCRNSLGGLWRQYFGYGYWKVFVMAKHRRLFAVRHVLPALFVGSLLIGGLIGIVTGRWLIFLLPGVLYLAGAVSVSTWLAARRGWRFLPIMPVVFAAIHGAYGLGFLVALFSRPFRRG